MPRHHNARLVVSQRGRYFTGKKYGGLRKVYGIWILLDPPVSQHNTVSMYSMGKHDLVGAAQVPRGQYDLTSIVAIRIGGPQEPGYTGVLKLLGTLLSNDASLDEKRKVLAEFGIAVDDAMESEMRDMGSFADALESKARRQGRAEGKAEGRAEGKAEKRAEIEKDMAKVLAEDPKISLLDAIARLGLSVDVARAN